MPFRGSTPGGESSGEHCSREASLRRNLLSGHAFQGEQPWGKILRGSTAQEEHLSGGSPQWACISGVHFWRSCPQAEGTLLRGSIPQGNLLSGHVFQREHSSGGHVSEGESLGRISSVGMHFRGSTPQQGSPQGEHFSGGASLRGISSVGMHVRGAFLQGDVLRGVSFRVISSVGMHCRGAFLGGWEFP